MAKKKTSKKTEPEETSDEELEDSLLGGDDEAEKEPEVVVEKKKKTSKAAPEEAEAAPVEAPSEEPSAPSLPEEEKVKKDYKYLKSKLLSEHFNTYRIEFVGESHGFLNLLNSKALQEKGVVFSAYKETSIDPPVLTVVTDGSITAMKVLNNVAESMKKDFLELKKVVSQTIK